MDPHGSLIPVSPQGGTGCSALHWSGVWHMASRPNISHKYIKQINNSAHETTHAVDS